MLRLERVTRENWREGLDVRASDDQAPMVAGFQPVLLVILAKAAVRVGAVDWWPFLLRDDGDVVGVVAVADHREEHKTLTIFHLLIDVRVQRRGHGHAALTQLAELARRTDRCDTVALTVNPHNHSAVRLYQSFGFDMTGTDNEGELQMALALSAPDAPGAGLPSPEDGRVVRAPPDGADPGQLGERHHAVGATP